MGRTKRTQVALYLDDDKVEALQKFAAAGESTQQLVLRAALDRILADYEWRRSKRPDGRCYVHELVRKSARRK